MKDTYIGARYLPIYYDNGTDSEWTPNTEYEPLTIVTYNGFTFTSKTIVPNTIGNPIENGKYWIMTPLTPKELKGLYDYIEGVASPFIDGDFIEWRVLNHLNQEGFIYTRKVPKEYAPKVAYADTLEYPETIANIAHATCSINASRWRTGGTFAGYFRTNHVTLNGNENVIENSYDVLLYDSEHGLYSEPTTKTTQELDSLNPEWGLVGFETIIADGNIVTDNDPNDIHPRSCIGQLYDGSFIILTTDGRSGRTEGYNLYTLGEFVKTNFPNIKFLYSLDGGGSVCLSEKGYRVNPFINNEHRKVKSVIYFELPSEKGDSYFQTAITLNNFVYRALNNNYEYKQGVIYSYTTGTTKQIEFYDLNTLELQSFIRMQAGRFFAGFTSDFDTDGGGLLFDISRSSFVYNNIARSLLPRTSLPIDYTNEIPTGLSGGFYGINIVGSAKAVELGLTNEDYGQSAFFVLRTNQSLGLLFTRANIYYITSNYAPIKLS